MDVLLYAFIIAVLWLCLQWGASFHAKPEKPQSAEERLSKAIRAVLEEMRDKK